MYNHNTHTENGPMHYANLVLKVTITMKKTANMANIHQLVLAYVLGTYS